ncbi:MAG: transglutaminase family protein, partial [Phycisphaerae bacterium]
INTADPQLVQLAKRTGGSIDQPFALADRLRRFVTGYVVNKNLNVGFATASEVCRTKQGDCSEHAVLLAALGRLRGFPTRVAVGLAYVPQMGALTNVFGYHMWAQFFIKGKWIDLDAALGETRCSPTRIAFATSSLRDAGLADLSLPLLSKIGGITIEVLEIE